MFSTPLADRLVCYYFPSPLQNLNMATCKRIDTDQAMGPHRPTVQDLMVRLAKLPKHLEVASVVINGQTNRLFITTRHEDLEHEHEDNCHD